MPDSLESDTSFVYVIPFPSVSRGIALAGAAFFVCIFAGFLLQFGFNSIRSNPSLWLFLVATLGSGFIFFMVLGFPPKRWNGRIEITSGSIQYFPRLPLRWMGEPSTEIRVGTDAREVLVCQGSQDRSDKIFNPAARKHMRGYRIVLRSEGGQTRELKIMTGDRLTRRQARILSDGMAAELGIPVRLVQREVLESGELREITWTPVSRSVNLAGIAKLAFIATPYIGGLVVGIIRPGWLVVLAVGVCLWLLQTLAIYLYAAISKQWSKSVAIQWLIRVVNFATSYTLMFLITAYILLGQK
jgi:hypothetical protein